MLEYIRIISLLKEYFRGIDNWKKLFLHGGCYWLASLIQSRVEGSYLVVNRVKEHCAVCIDSRVYDVTGQIDKGGYHRASDREISFMKKAYGPLRFDSSELLNYINSRV